MAKQIESKKKRSEKAVVVFTDKRGVVFGYASKTSGDPVTLSRARMCVYWSKETGGALGLGSDGPATGSRITKPVPSIELRGVTAVMECSPAAVAAWESAPWA